MTDDDRVDMPARAAQAQLSAIILLDQLVENEEERAAVRDETGRRYAVLAPDAQLRLASHAYRACEEASKQEDSQAASAFLEFLRGYAAQAEGNEGVQAVFLACLLLDFGRALTAGDLERSDARLADLRAQSKRVRAEDAGPDALAHALVTRMRAAHAHGDDAGADRLLAEIRDLERACPSAAVRSHLESALAYAAGRARENNDEALYESLAAELLHRKRR